MRFNLGAFLTGILSGIMVVGLLLSCGTQIGIRPPTPIPKNIEILDEPLPATATIDTFYASVIIDTVESGAAVLVPVVVIVSGDRRAYFLVEGVPRTAPDSTTEREAYRILWYGGLPVIDPADSLPAPSP